MNTNLEKNINDIMEYLGIDLNDLEIEEFNETYVKLRDKNKNYHVFRRCDNLDKYTWVECGVSRESIETPTNYAIGNKHAVRAIQLFENTIVERLHKNSARLRVPIGKYKFDDEHYKNPIVYAEFNPNYENVNDALLTMELRTSSCTIWSRNADNPTWYGMYKELEDKDNLKYMFKIAEMAIKMIYEEAK